jgi:undecaprenyl-diphosphatase
MSNLVSASGILKAIVLGIVQGLSEFLPISSTAHLRVVPALLGWDDPGAAFSAVIQLGTTAAILVYFSRDIVDITRGFFGSLARGEPTGSLQARLGWCVIVGTLPVVVVGLAASKVIEHQARSLYIIAFAAIALAVLLAVAEIAARHLRPIGSVGIRDGVVVGLAQAVALIPGSSRSGVTLTAGLFLGLTREAAARFSFLLSIPATVAAGLFEARHVLHAGREGEVLALAPVIVGTAVSFVVGYATIAGLLRFLQTRSTAVFIAYRILLGVGLLVLLGTEFLRPL